MARGHRSVRSALAGQPTLAVRVAVTDDSAMRFGPAVTRPATPADWEALEPLLIDAWREYTEEGMARALADTGAAAVARMRPGDPPSVFLVTMAEDISQLLGYPHGSHTVLEEFDCAACGAHHVDRGHPDDAQQCGYTPAGLVCTGCLPPRDAAHEYGYMSGVHDPVRWTLAALRAHAAGEGPPAPTGAHAQRIRDRILGEGY